MRSFHVGHRGTILALVVTFVACSDPPPLDRSKAAGMIEATAAFRAPLDEDLMKLDPRFAAEAKREIVKIEAVAVKPDGPFGMAGQTAIVSFVWRFDKGPLAGIQHRTIARIHGDSKGWKVYEDTLEHNLRESIAGND
jgi:hypothetical protein